MSQTPVPVSVVQSAAGDKAPSSAEQLLEGLSPTQITALTAIAKGSTIAAAAETAKVGRVTVHRWMRKDAAFRAAYNAWIHEQKESARARLVRLAEEAVEAVGRALRVGDAKLAFALLKEMGLLAKIADGPTDRTLVAREIGLEEREEEQAVKEREEQQAQQAAGMTAEGGGEMLSALTRMLAKGQPAA